MSNSPKWSLTDDSRSLQADILNIPQELLLYNIYQLVNMDSQESENISQFTTDNSTANPGDVVDASVVEGSQSWDADVEIEIPE
ncbi:hypothetical protein AWC38_SpisGene22472, partial [Stylophora pistillata]